MNGITKPTYGQTIPIRPANWYEELMKKKYKYTEDWEKYIGTMPSITGEQAAVSTPLSEYLAEALAGIGDQPSFEEWARTNMPDTFGGPLGGQAQGVYSEAMQGITPDMFGGELGGQAQAAYEQAMSDVAPDMFGGELGSEAQAAYAEALSGVAPSVFGGPLGAEAQAAYRQAMTGETPEGAEGREMFGGPLGAEAKSAYAEALSGIPVGYDPSGASFLQNIIPAIKESYVGTGAITGTEVGREIGRQAEVEKENIARVKAGLFEQAKGRQAIAAHSYVQAFKITDEAEKNRALSAVGMYQTAYQSGQEQAKQRQLMAAGNYQQAYQNAVQYAKDRAQAAASSYQQSYQGAGQYAKDRALSAANSYQQAQLELTKLAYDNYVRQNPAATEILQSALSYLNIPLMAAYQKPTDEAGKPVGSSSPLTSSTVY